jgi:hypothetical protein
MASLQNQRALIRVFAALRFATGVSAWLAPTKTARIMRLGSDHQQPLTTQLFGSRELTLAAAIMDTSPQLRTRALQLGLLVDGLDVLAAFGGVRRHTLSVPGATFAGGGAALFAVLGMMALSGEKRRAQLRHPVENLLGHVAGGDQ